MTKRERREQAALLASYCERGGDPAVWLRPYGKRTRRALAREAREILQARSGKERDR